MSTVDKFDLSTITSALHVGNVIPNASVWASRSQLTASVTVAITALVGAGSTLGFIPADYLSPDAASSIASVVVTVVLAVQTLMSVITNPHAGIKQP